MRISLVVLVTLLVSSCGSSSTGEGNKEVKKSIDAFTDFYSDKDAKVLKGLFTTEPQAIIYGISSDIWKGEETIRKKMEKTAEDVEDSNIDVRDQVIKVNGDVAWFSQRGDWSYDLKGQRVELEGVRITGVLLREEGRWKIAQWHTSYPLRVQQQQYNYQQ